MIVAGSVVNGLTVTTSNGINGMCLGICTWSDSAVNTGKVYVNYKQGSWKTPTVIGTV